MQVVATPNFRAPNATRWPVSFSKHGVELQSSNVSSPHPDCLVSSFVISKAVQSRAPMLKQALFATFQVVIPSQPPKGPPGSSSLSPQTRGSPNSSAFNQPRSAHDETDVSLVSVKFGG
jgi:hypothetical protein